MIIAGEGVYKNRRGTSSQGANIRAMPVAWLKKMFEEKPMNRNMQSPDNSFDDLFDEDSPEERPPVFRTWRRLYLAVFGNLVLLIVIFYILTRMFS